jgi:hypothetical protein
VTRTKNVIRVLIVAVLAATLGLPSVSALAIDRPTSSAAAPAADHGAAGSSATAVATSRPSVVRGYDQPAHLSRSRTSSTGLVLATRAGRGEAGPVRLGQAGEDAVRGAYNIGDKVPIRVAGRGRIPDGLTPTTLSEVKNVGSLSYTSQLRDFVSYARQTNRRVDLYVSPETRLSKPLAEASRDPNVPIHLRRIP